MTTALYSPSIIYCYTVHQVNLTTSYEHAVLNSFLMNLEHRLKNNFEHRSILQELGKHTT